MYKIGITGVGGGVGQSIIKALQNSDYVLIGMDGEHLGTGLYAVDRAYTIPYANNPTYIERLLQICRDNDIKLLFPGLDAELEILSKNRDKFLAIGTQVVVSDMDIIDIAENKWLTFEKLSAMGFHVPLTIKLSDVKEMLPFPFIVKPFVGGARSKDVFLIRNEDEYKSVLEKIDTRKENFIMQEFLSGDEFTCGTVTLEGHCCGAIVMERELRAGDTYKCFSVDKPEISQYLVALMNTIKPFGACNVQLKLKNGEPYIFEINARCSGTTAARALCGFNEPLMIANYLLKGIKPTFDIQHKAILRYWKELVIEPETIETIKDKGQISHTKAAQL